MTQNNLDLACWFVRDEYRAIAEIKYQLKQWEGRLNQYLDVNKECIYFPVEVNSICENLAYQYLDYLKLIDGNITRADFELPASMQSLHWHQQYSLISQLKFKLSRTVNQKEECKLIQQIASLYYHFNKLIQSPPHHVNALSGHSEELKQLFITYDLQTWLTAVVVFCNKNNTEVIELSSVFHEWNPQQLQHALDFFAREKLVNLVNAMFFYKLYPDKLFNELIHPEKLVSVRARVEILHRYIEGLEQQLYYAALQQGLKPEVDYLFHGDDIPQGIMIEVDEEFRELIQTAIKTVIVKYTYESEEQVTIERLHDLGRAYKFWFNPNRLIDAVMVLQQRLVKDDVAEDSKLSVFHQKMVFLYGQLTTTECLDLYGYFANNDSRYLLYTLFTIDNGHPLEWLPELNTTEKKAITRVFKALQCVMEALREELKLRHIRTNPYGYNVVKQQIHTGRRNRGAVFRIIAIYGNETVTLNDTVEQLFHFIEDTSLARADK